MRADLATIKCPNNYTSCVSSSTCLKFVKQKVNFDAAKSLCNGENASLFIPTNEVEAKCAIQLAANKVEIKATISGCSLNRGDCFIYSRRLFIDDF